MDKETPGNLRIGPAGWAYDDWKGVVYPPDMPRSLHPLTYLSRYFDTIEINSTFYRPQPGRVFAGWAEKVAENPRFQFAAKLWQRFTHERATWPEPAEIALAQEGLRTLHDAGRLGAVLVQFPWSFQRTPENRQWLARVLDAFAAYPLVLEVRHASWNRPEMYDGLAQRGVAFCNIDQPVFGNSIAPSAYVTAPVGYVRLHGRNHDNWFREDARVEERYDYLYTLEELEPWIEKIERICRKVKEMFVITNNHYRGQAVVNAFEMAARFGKKRMPPPPHLAEVYPRLAACRVE